MGRGKIIIGTEGDTVKSIKRTFALFQNVTFPLVRTYTRTPKSSSKMTVELKESTHLIHEDYKKYSTFERVFSPKKLSPKKLLEVYKWINKNFFSIKNILRYQLRYILAFFVNIHHRVYAIKDETLLIL